MPDLLIELFSEEIPARMQGQAAADLKKLVTEGLVEAGLTYASAGAFATPRRLALSVEGLTAESPERREERKGPRTDAPEKALEGFLRSTGLTKDQLVAKDAGKAQAWFAEIVIPGRTAAEITAEVLEKTVRNFPWPKSMRWGEGSLRWVRPLHSILCILSDESGATVVPLTIDGITAGDSTCGHRFMAPARFSVTNFEHYSAKLKRAFVVLSAEERADHIWHDATNAAFAQGLEVVEDKGLLSEVAGLVEWPVVLMGEIEEAFLGLPPEVLQTSMKEHQKFFSVKNPRTGRIEKFVTVANRETADHGATVLQGNQKVLTARLSDARFFWENDRRVAKAGMGEWLDSLANVTFHNRLGSQKDRMERITALAREIAPLVGADAVQAAEAARIAKADLRSEMVGEFPELQGVMGRYYALEAGQPGAVADAARDHYAPLGPSDAVPHAPVSVAVALADKLDTLTGFWAIDEKPTGSKDPFALRRAALGVIRLVLENKLRFEIISIISLWMPIAAAKWQSGGYHVVSDASVEGSLAFGPEAGLPEDFSIFGSEVGFTRTPDVRNVTFEASEYTLKIPGLWLPSLIAFLHDRLKVFLRDRGIRHDVIDACLAMPGTDDLTLLVARAQALSDFLKTEDGENLLQGFKRANNILTQAEDKDGVEYSFGADIKFAEDPTEKALFSALSEAEPKIDVAMEAEDFAAAMSAMAALRAPVDAFFEAVQVNSDNQILRRNRLNLLSTIRRICLGVADLTRVEG